MRFGNLLKIILFVFLGLVLVYAVLLVFKKFQLKTYTSAGTAEKIDFPKITFTYPADWQVKEDAKPGKDNIYISKGDYVVGIEQELVAGLGTCPADFAKVEFKEVTTNQGQMRYFLDSTNEENSKNLYYFCQKEGTEYIFPSVGTVYINTPKTINTKTLDEAVEIVKSISTN